MVLLLKPCSSRMEGMHQGKTRATGLDLTKSCLMTLPQRQAIRYTLRLNRPKNGSSQTFLKTYNKRWQRPPQPRLYGRILRQVPGGSGFAGSARSKHRRPARSISQLRSTNSTKACDAPAVLTAISVVNPTYRITGCSASQRTRRSNVRCNVGKSAKKLPETPGRPRTISCGLQRNHSVDCPSFKWFLSKRNPSSVST